MSKLYACIIGMRNVECGVQNEAGNESSPLVTHHSSLVTESSSLVALAEQFAYRIEVVEGGILFDVSGLENRIGPPGRVAQSIAHEMETHGITGSLALAANAATAELYARTRAGVTVIGEGDEMPLPLASIGLDEDTLGIFHALGMETTADLKGVPEDELIARYGREFRRTLDLVDQRGVHILTPNLKENRVAWDYNLDFPVEDLGQLIFILGHGLGKVLAEAGNVGLSSEQIDIVFGLDDKTTAEYSIKLSFPTLDKAFWLKLANLRLGNDPPAAAIVSMRVTCHFARPRAIERGLFAATRPEPESLLLTADKIRKLVGKENVGVPMLVDQRLPEAFALDADKLPQGKEMEPEKEQRPVLALTHFHPPLEAEIKTAEGRLIYLRTRYFDGHVAEYGGAWLGSSQWWTHGFWQQMEWDVELDDRRIYRLARTQEGWFVTGGYD
ncbi:MAG: hypothetical protein IPM21_14670 [Acidobacteria bacterium]|nr:hypothetical protein [Acidobacteriota bacterium]